MTISSTAQPIPRREPVSAPSQALALDLAVYRRGFHELDRRVTALEQASAAAQDAATAVSALSGLLEAVTKMKAFGPPLRGVTRTVQLERQVKILQGRLDRLEAQDVEGRG